MRRLLVAVLALAPAAAAAAGPVADSVTMRPRAVVVKSNEFAVGATGAVSSGAQGEYVSITGKECGVPAGFWRALAGATTLAGGGWEASVPIRTTTTLRAEWRNATSATVVVRKRPYVALVKEPDGFRVTVGSDVTSTDGKRVIVERLAPTGWKSLQTVVVKSSGYAGWSERDGLRFTVPRGTTLRAVLPLSQAKPCYLAGYSKLVRT